MLNVISNFSGEKIITMVIFGAIVFFSFAGGIVYHFLKLKRRQEEWEQADKMFQGVFNQVTDSIVVVDKEGIISIGFKAEMDETTALNSATRMLENKNLDGDCLNILNEENSFGSENNNIELILKNSSQKIEGSKLEVSMNILEELEKEFVKYE